MNQWLSSYSNSTLIFIIKGLKAAQWGIAVNESYLTESSMNWSLHKSFVSCHLSVSLISSITSYDFLFGKFLLRRNEFFDFNVSTLVIIVHDKYLLDDIYFYSDRDPERI